MSATKRCVAFNAHDRGLGDGAGDGRASLVVASESSGCSRVISLQATCRGA